MIRCQSCGLVEIKAFANFFVLKAMLALIILSNL